MSKSIGRSIAARINAAHDAFEKGMRSAIPHAIKAGQLLNEAKAKVGHGQWLDWLRANFRASPRTAQVYMRAAERGGAIEANAQLPALLAIGVDETPGRDGRIERLEAARASAANRTRQAERRQKVTARAAAVPPSADPGWRLVAADCRDALAAEPEASADVVFADPPFNIGFNYRLYKDDLPDGEYLAFSREWMGAELLKIARRLAEKLAAGRT